MVLIGSLLVTINHQLLRARILLSLLLLIAFIISACDNDDHPCPEVNQPPVQELTQWEKERFPYGNYDTLVFVIEEPGRYDTVKLGRIYYDSMVVSRGDSIDVSTGCDKAFANRSQLFTAIYGSSYKDRLIFTNNEDAEWIEIKWEKNNTFVGHNWLNKFLKL